MGGDDELDREFQDWVDRDEENEQRAKEYAPASALPLFRAMAPFDPSVQLGTWHKHLNPASRAAAYAKVKARAAAEATRTGGQLVEAPHAGVVHVVDAQGNKTVVVFGRIEADPNSVPRVVVHSGDAQVPPSATVVRYRVNYEPI